MTSIQEYQTLARQAGLDDIISDGLKLYNMVG